MKRRRGFALFLALFVVLVLSIAGIGLLFGTSTEQALTGAETRASRTFYAADSGIGYAASAFKADAAYAGGAVPNGMSSNTPGQTASDIAVTVSKPVYVSYTIQPRDELQSQGNGYGTNQLVESSYLVSATATSDTLESSKTVSAQLAVYPSQLTPQ